MSRYYISTKMLMTVIIDAVEAWPKFNRLKPDYYQITAIDIAVAKQKQSAIPRKKDANWISHILSRKKPILITMTDAIKSDPKSMK